MPTKLLLASSNSGKLREYVAMAAGRGFIIEPLRDFDSMARFDEAAPTFAENAAGKALHFSRFSGGLIMADDSGLVVDALGGAPGVESARYGGPGASDADRVEKLLQELGTREASDRRARFVCVIAVARQGRALGVVSGSVEGEILEAPRGRGGFGYDPVFYFPALGKTFAELSSEEKNLHSHRSKAFRRLLDWLQRGEGPAGRL